MASQSGFNTVEVSWIPPSPPPSQGYRITVYSLDTSLDVNAVTSPHTLSLQTGLYSIQIAALYDNSSSIAGPVNVSIRGIITIVM